MDYLIHELIAKEDIQLLNEKLLKKSSHWESGKLTAGAHAAKVKNNQQLKKDSTIGIECSDLISNAILKDNLIKSFCIPKEIHGVMFSKSGINQGYGTHVDNAYMSTGRSDLSFTIFLNDKEQYEGGELCIQTMQEEKEFKLAKGQILIYPSTSLHSVKKVTSGERIVCVGWIHSYIKSNEDRNILFGLDAGARALLAKNGQSVELDLIFQAYNNLLRRLGE